MAKQKLVVPGSIIANTLKDYQISINQAAKDLALSSSAVRQIISGKIKISLQVALRLAKYFDQTPDYWVTLQTQCDLAEIRSDPKLSGIIKNIPRAKKAKAPPRSPKKDEKPGKAPKAPEDLKALKDSKVSVAKKSVKSAQKTAGVKKAVK
jgi:addiction module HigA family antidote